MHHFLALTVILIASVTAFSCNTERRVRLPCVKLCSQDAPIDGPRTSRRLFVATSVTSLSALVALPKVVHPDTGAEVRGNKITPFNSLIFQYRGNDFGGLKSSDLDEPSVPYQEFVDRLKKGEVEFVEFMAPNGDMAYVTFKGATPIRIGEGYPIERADGWSSPAFAVRTVKNAGVPYKFTVPALKRQG